MTDILSSEARSKNMAAIRHKDTKPEIYFRKKLFAAGFRYRINVRYIPGTPDIYLARYNTAFFVHGCFWHRHMNCKYAYTPKTRTDFWEKKFYGNIKRDRSVQELLLSQNIKCGIIWECTLNKIKRDIEQERDVFLQIEEFLKNDHLFFEI